MTEEKALTKTQSIIEFGQVTAGALIPRNFEGLYQLSTLFSESGLMPKGIDTVQKVFVCIQMGMEVGLSPMQAVQNIAPINGRPCIWGDAVLGLVRASGVLDGFEEKIEGEGEKMVAICAAMRKGEKTQIKRTFSVDDAKRAGLWQTAAKVKRRSKDGGFYDADNDSPWYRYPKRMLQMRARSWVLRDGFGDVLKGLRVAEEVMDYDMELTQQGGTYQAETQGEAEMPDVSETFESLSKDIAGPELDAFVKSTAARNKVTVEDLKKQAVEEWDRFLSVFQKSQTKKTAKTEAPKPEPEPEKIEPAKEKPPILCPSQKRGVLPGECEQCHGHEKCPAFVDWQFEEKQKQS